MKQLGIVILICMLVAPAMVFGQNEPGFGKMSLGANFELSVPVGDFSNFAGTGYGGNIKYQYGADTRSVFTATAGYIIWSKKDLLNNSSYLGATSIQWKAFNVFVGGKYYLAPGFFGSLEGGVYFLSTSFEGNYLTGSSTYTYFMLPIGLGYQKSGFEIAARYMLLHPDFNQISFTVGYNFSL